MNWSLQLILLLTPYYVSCQIDCFGEGLPKVPDTAGVRKGADEFAINLFKDIAVSYPSNSIVLSPFSVWSVLNLAYLGSGGQTESQLQTALGVPSKSDSFMGSKVIDATLQLNKGTFFNKADKAYFDESVSLRECAINKLTEIERVNFQDSQTAADRINKDVADTTRGKISRFLSPSIIKNAVFILLNAVYFKGLWTFPFINGSTTKRVFFDETGKVNISVADMMITQAKLRYAESEKLGASVLELPYENSNISMLVIMPQAGRTTVNSVLRQMTSDDLDEVTKNLSEKTAVVTFPRFKMTTRIADELKQGLLNLGVSDLFDETRVDLSKFMNDKGVFVDSALHHATIEVTEEGTVAAAATALVGTRSRPSDLLIFNADRPFIFLIRDMSQGITLFTGVLRDPKHTIPF